MKTLKGLCRVLAIPTAVLVLTPMIEACASSQDHLVRGTRGELSKPLRQDPASEPSSINDRPSNPAPAGNELASRPPFPDEWLTYGQPSNPTTKCAIYFYNRYKNLCPADAYFLARKVEDIGGDELLNRCDELALDDLPFRISPNSNICDAATGIAL